ncbi:hypothetical protein ACFRAE_04010 [Sphingobacterium sp. HJSM2_6]|uniref:hypothetical protein n=1 Tax=Sphingobacterium sp. HJSM2_6 TaxID=3366264 RepID=UPI003BDF01F4
MFHKKKSNNSADQVHSQHAHPFIKNKFFQSAKPYKYLSLQQILDDLSQKNYKFSNN